MKGRWTDPYQLQPTWRSPKSGTGEGSWAGRGARASANPMQRETTCRRMTSSLKLGTSRYRLIEAKHLPSQAACPRYLFYQVPPPSLRPGVLQLLPPRPNTLDSPSHQHQRRRRRRRRRRVQGGRASSPVEDRIQGATEAAPTASSEPTALRSGRLRPYPYSPSR